MYKMLNFLIDNTFVQYGGHVLQHLICIKIGTGILAYGIFSILFLGIWDMCPLNYWDIALSFWVFLGIFLAFDRKSILGIWDICLFI
jgi:hypothetical protein